MISPMPFCPPLEPCAKLTPVLVSTNSERIGSRTDVHRRSHEGIAHHPASSTKHLRVMERSGLVHHKRSGRESVWQLEHRSLDEARRYLEAISKQWDDRLPRLRRLLE